MTYHRHDEPRWDEYGECYMCTILKLEAEAAEMKRALISIRIGAEYAQTIAAETLERIKETKSS